MPAGDKDVLPSVVVEVGNGRGVPAIGRVRRVRPLLRVASAKPRLPRLRNKRERLTVERRENDVRQSVIISGLSGTRPSKSPAGPAPAARPGRAMDQTTRPPAQASRYSPKTAPQASEISPTVA